MCVDVCVRVDVCACVRACVCGCSLGAVFLRRIIWVTQIVLLPKSPSVRAKRVLGSGAGERTCARACVCMCVCV